MHEEYRYSLCITYQGNRGQNIAYRIADYNPVVKMFSEADYTDKYAEDYREYQPTIIGANPLELVFEEAGVRRWKPQEENDHRQYSYTYNDVQVYEVIKDTKLIAAKNKEDLVEALCKGITIPPSVQGEFFLIIGDVGSQYEAIICSKKDFNASGDRYALNYNVDDMLHTTHSFDTYMIKKSDIITNSYLRDILNIDSVTSLRFFYKYTYLPERKGLFVPRNPEAYVNAYLKWFCKKADSKVEFTRKEVDRLVDLLSVSVENEATIETFFKDAPFSKDEIAMTLMRHSDTVNSFFAKDDSTDNALANIVVQNPGLFEKCIRLVENKWLAESSELREKEEEKLRQIKSAQENHEQIITALETEESEKKRQINDLQCHLMEVRGLVEQAEVQKKNIKKEIAECAERFEKDIVNFMKIEGVFRYNSNSSPQSVETASKTSDRYTVSDICLRKEVIETETPEGLYEFLDDLTDNISIWFDHAHEIAITVLAIIFQRKAAIVANSYGHELASAVALLMDGKPPRNYSMATNMEAVFETAKAINLSEEKNIYVSGILDTFFEMAIPTLLQLCPNKVFWFGTTAIDSLKLMSKSIYEDTVVLDVESDMRFISGNEPLWKAKEDVYKFQPVCETRLIDKVYSQFIAPLYENKYIKKSSAIMLSKMIAAYLQMSEDRIVGSVIQKSILVMLSDQDDIQELVRDTLEKRLDE